MILSFIDSHMDVVLIHMECVVNILPPPNKMKVLLRPVALADGSLIYSDL